jgi:hypothetical protein
MPRLVFSFLVRTVALQNRHPLGLAFVPRGMRVLCKIFGDTDYGMLSGYLIFSDKRSDRSFDSPVGKTLKRCFSRAASHGNMFATDLKR